MMLYLRSALSLLAAFVLTFAPVAAQAQAQAAEWNVDRGSSSIRFSGTNSGAAFNGQFGQWTARIRFDPRNLAGSRIIVVIETGSATTGDRVQETTLKTGEWFDSGNHRFANFRSTSITSRGGNRYQARGTLEIKGKTTPVTLPFTLAIEGNRARASGTLTLDRIALGIGTKSDPRAQYVSRNIELAINVTATRG
jgi:cytochrome b561